MRGGIRLEAISPASLIAEVFELHGLFYAHGFDELHCRLKVVALLARDAELFALNGDLHFNLLAFDRLDDFLGGFLINTFFDGDTLTNRHACGFFFLAIIELPRLNAAFREVAPQDFLNLFQLQLVIGMNCLLYTSPSPRDRTRSRMPSSA